MIKEFEDEKRKYYLLSDNVYVVLYIVIRYRDLLVLKGVIIC